MAKQTVKKSEDKEIKEVNKTEDVKTSKEIVSESNQDEINILKTQLEEMKKAMEEMLKAKAELQSERVIVKTEEQDIEIGTRLVQGVGFTSTDKTIELTIKSDEIQALSLAEMKKLLRQSEIRRLFENGVCYFVNEEDYVLLGIRKHIDLSTENLQEILSSKDLNHIVKTFNTMSSNLKNATVVHCLIFKICDMIRKGELPSLDYNIRKGTADYFGLEGFESGIKTLTDLEQARG